MTVEKSLATSDDKWFVLQTNYDPNEVRLHSFCKSQEPDYLDDRRDPGLACMRKMSQNKLSAEGLYEARTQLRKCLGPVLHNESEQGDSAYCGHVREYGPLPSLHCSL